MAGHYELLDQAPEDYYCPISMKLLVNANQTSCCGTHISEDVANKMEKEKKPCPFCRKVLKSHNDLYFRRLVSQVKVFCSKKSLGCKWTGELNQLQNHLKHSSVEGECKYVEVQCPYICFAHIQRRKLRKHMEEYCPKRAYTCNYCNLEGTYLMIIDNHLPVCVKFPTRCPNNCDELICRGEVKNHIETACPLQVATCEFSYAGCTPVGLCRKDMMQHMEENTHLHLSMLARHGRQKSNEIEALKAQVQLLTNIVAQHHSSRGLLASTRDDLGFIKPGVMVLENFRSLQHLKESWISPGFYSHIGGYKMRLMVFPLSETDENRNEYMGMYLQMLQGEYDDQLHWPFYGTVDVKILNQLEDKTHIEIKLLQSSSYSNESFRISMVDKVRGSLESNMLVWGDKRIVALKYLALNTATNTQYLKENTIKFQVSNVTHITITK